MEHARYISSLLLFLVCTTHSAFTQQRPFTPDDVLHLEKLDGLTTSSAFSPDAKWLAYVVKRSKDSDYEMRSGRDDRGDVWLVATTGGEPTNITTGANSGSGYWNVAWSPDSRRLAMFSTNGSDNPRIWLWDILSKKLRQLFERGVDFTVPPLWVSDSELVVLVRARDKKAIPIEGEESAIREWRKARTGKESSSNVLESAAVDSYSTRPQGQLMSIDVDKNTTQTIMNGTFKNLRLSPDRRHIAFLKQVDIIKPTPNRLIQHVQYWKYELMVASLNNKQWSVKSIKDDPRIGPIRWVPEIDPTGLAWSGAGDLIVRAEGVKPSESTSPTTRFDWWLVEEPGSYRNLTARMKSVPAVFVPEVNDGSFVGVADGDLWRIRTDGSVPRNLTESYALQINSVAWPRTQVVEGGRFRQIIVSSEHGMTNDLYRVDLSSDQLVPVIRPSSEADLFGFAPTAGVLAFREDTRDGTKLWLSTIETSKFRIVHETNTFLRGIAEGQAKTIEYRNLDGRKLKAWLILPPNYQTGRRYPMITWVYPGTIATDNPSEVPRLNRSDALNKQLLVARGYAVLIPSMPLRAADVAGDPYMELTSGVLPAVDKAIDIGIADPKRLGLMGHSFGGYGVYGIITQSNRFQAAIASAGPSDFASFYGTLSAYDRYDDYAHENQFNMSIAETGQFGMGNPPWRDMGRYLRNSPLSYVDRVETPLMIVHGDMDYVPIQQGEQFFMALYRQGKRASFVRYWGEGHGLESPANIRDMWHRVFAWFDEFLDILRDEKGSLVWEGDKIKSRNGSAPLKPEDFARFDQIVLKEFQTKN